MNQIYMCPKCGRTNPTNCVFISECEFSIAPSSSLDRINSGDLFILNGETYECEGTDGGYIWYDNGEMELAKAEIQGCVKTWYCMDEIPTKKRCDQQCDYCRRGNTKFLCPICGKTELEEAFGTTDLYCPSCKPEGYTDPNYRFTNLWKNPKLSLNRSGSEGEEYWKAKFAKWCEDYHKLNGMIEIPHDYSELKKQRDNFLLGIRITIATTPDKDTVKYLTDVIKVHNLEP